jgi:hypothetical protein
MPAQVIYGGLNPSSLLLDNVYINVKPPQPVLTSANFGLDGAAVGGASWGPKNTPIRVATPQDLIAAFGPPINSGFDIVQEGSLFLNQLPQGAFIGVRVAHSGTDAAAAGMLVDSSSADGLNLIAIYTGSFGNKLKVILQPGSKSVSGTPTWMVIVAPGNLTPEVFDNIAQGGIAGEVWTNIYNALKTGVTGINNGNPSSYVVPTLASSILPPTAASVQTVTLTGGLDGATGITSTDQLGVDGPSGSRTGIYALRSFGFDAIWLAGNSDSATWSTLSLFAQDQSGVAYASFPKNTSITAAVTAKLSAGIDTPYEVLLKDWVTYLDSIVGMKVTVPASCVVAGIACRVSPEQSPGNKPAYGLVGTENTLNVSAQPYSNVDLGTLEAAGINIITNPIPSGNTFGLRHGKNTSSNFATSEIPYARKTNDLIRAFSGPVMGQFVDQLQSTQANDPTRESINSALNGYLGPQKANGIINDYSVRCDLSNNSVSTIQAGFCYADVVVSYLAVVDKFILSLVAGQTVSVVSANQQAG